MVFVIDDCIGVVDECGVCNGATEVVIEVRQCLDVVWFEVGADTTFSYQCDPSLQFSCGDPSAINMNTVQIGEQFAEATEMEMPFHPIEAMMSGMKLEKAM